MYIRRVNKKNSPKGEIYTTYRLVENYRNAAGDVRQDVILGLGAGFNIDPKDWKVLTNRVEEILDGQQSLFMISSRLEREAEHIANQIIKRRSAVALAADLVADDLAVCKEVNQASKSSPTIKSSSALLTNKDYQNVDLNSLKHHDIRTIGAEYVGYNAALQLGLPAILLETGLNKKQVNVALSSIIARLCFPASELSTHDYLQKTSALDEILETDFTNLALKNLYLASDLLLKHKDALETHLYQKEKDLFNLKEVITLFDITNTYVEGRSLSNPKAKYGRSKEKRSDCKLVALGLVLDASGFPKKSKIFPGNISEPATLKEMIDSLVGNDGASSKADYAINQPNHNQADDNNNQVKKISDKIINNEKVTIVMDAGIATENNIAYLKEHNYQYIVVSRNHNLAMPDSKTIMVKEDPGNNVTASLVINDQTDEVELYCHSQAKEAKASEILTKITQRYETELTKLHLGLNKPKATKQYDKILTRLGRLAEKYKTVHMLYDITVTTDQDKKNKIFAKENVIAIKYRRKKNLLHKKESGIYCLRSNRRDLDAKTLWETYTMLTDLEAAFRSLKSELGFRPVYHQKEARVDGHLFISILAYHLLHTIRYQLKQHGIHHSWESLRRILNRQLRVTSNLQLADGRSVNIRKTSTANIDQLVIYQALGISSLPGKVVKTYTEGRLDNF